MIILIQPFLLSHGFAIGWHFSLLQVPMWLASVLGGLLAFQLLRLAGTPRALAVVGVLATLGYLAAGLWDHAGALAFLVLIPAGGVAHRGRSCSATSTTASRRASARRCCR